ncbi:hypothetical protein EDB80DRAFT_691618 [Ilyonectria destructans]|nr:hypothetical protein EDB80DRAFT_691618 [Ilyonectria destructans]
MAVGSLIREGCQMMNNRTKYWLYPMRPVYALRRGTKFVADQERTGMPHEPLDVTAWTDDTTYSVLDIGTGTVLAASSSPHLTQPADSTPTFIADSAPTTTLVTMTKNAIGSVSSVSAPPPLPPRVAATTPVPKATLPGLLAAMRVSGTVLAGPSSNAVPRYLVGAHGCGRRHHLREQHG